MQDVVLLSQGRVNVFLQLDNHSFLLTGYTLILTTPEPILFIPMDPLSITAAAVGITDFAISRIIELHDFINSIAEAKQEIHDAQSNLDNIHRTLIALGDLNISDNAAALEDVNKTSVAEAVNSCGDACKRFSGDLKKWTKHSSVDHMPLRDRFVVNVWNKEKVRTFRTNLQGCQTTVQFAVTSCQL